jgi:hypothetical protein
MHFLLLFFGGTLHLSSWCVMLPCYSLNIPTISLNPDSLIQGYEQENGKDSIS